VSGSHWTRWHEAYEDPASSLSQRLVLVQRRVLAAIDEVRDGPVRLISMCAGRGRDVIGVLEKHPRANDVSARLVELDPRLAADARRSAIHAELSGLQVIQGDASTTSAYEGAVPADVVLVCGVFGNISESDIEATVFELPRLTAPGATVVWTRHRRPPDLTPTIRRWFVEAGFQEVAFDTVDGSVMAVGTNRLVGAPARFRAARRMFTFVGDGTGARI
jgi:hypothetical protein